MPDWIAYVTAHLGRDGDPQVVEELASHLEETYQSLRQLGIAENEALRHATGQVQNWQKLRKQIVHAKEGPMNDRVRRLWIPGLVSFFGAAVSLVIVGKLGAEPKAFLATPLPPVVFYVPWLLALLVFGALGAFLARKAQAQGICVHISSTFPAILMAIAMVATLVIMLMLQGRTPPALGPGTFVAAGISWVLVPAVALLSGDVVCQWLYNRREQSL
jgi:hypothetical protein